MTPFGVAAKLKISLMEARELHARHKAVHATFHRWMADVVTTAQFTGKMQSVFGWPQRVDENVSIRTVMNFFSQANAAEMLRAALIAATEAGLQVCAPLHDAILLQARLEDLDDAIVAMQDIMRRAGKAVTGGLPVEAHVEHLVRWPDRYPSRSKDGRDTWGTVLNVLRQLGRRIA
jgi:DNA polymerase I